MDNPEKGFARYGQTMSMDTLNLEINESVKGIGNEDDEAELINERCDEEPEPEIDLGRLGSVQCDINFQTHGLQQLLRGEVLSRGVDQNLTEISETAFNGNVEDLMLRIVRGSRTSNTAAAAVHAEDDHIPRLTFRWAAGYQCTTGS